MTPPKRLLIAVTGFYGPFYPSGEKSGVFYSEVLHPYEIFSQNGFEIVIASENGKVGLDEKGASEAFLTAGEIKILEDEKAPVNIALKNIKKASDLNAKDFGIFFAAGGHGTCVDFENATDLQNLATDIYANGGVVSAVCHGPVLLGGVKDKKTGEPLIKGKKVTGFTDRGEELLGLTQFLKDHKYPFVTGVLKESGAEVIEPAGPWDDFAITDGRIVTGANPASSSSVSRQAIAAFA